MLLKVIIALFIIIVKTVVSINLGDSCILTSGEQGICKKFAECNSLLDNLCTDYIVCSSSNDFWPNICCKDGAKSKMKCQEYAEITAKLERAYPQMCKAHKPLIYGGMPVEPMEFPHQALLGYGDESISWQCGGTLISDQFVLTAAHCLYDQQRQPVSTVRLGEYDLSTEEDNAKPEDFKVIDRYTHVDRHPPQKYHDIALLKLDRSVVFSQYIRPACLHTTFDIPLPNYIENLRFLATGWGVTEQFITSPILLKVIVDYYDHETCSSSYKTHTRFYAEGINNKTQICAGGKNEEKDTCQGDSGGPLQIYHQSFKCMYDVVGITSFGKTCGVLDLAAIYTRVSAYIDWIEKIVWP